MTKSEEAVGRVEASYTQWYAEELPLPGEPEAAPLEGGLNLIETYTGLSREEVRRHVKAIVRGFPDFSHFKRTTVHQQLTHLLLSARQGLRHLQVPVPRTLALPDPVPPWLPRVPEHSPSPQVRRQASRCRVLLRPHPPPTHPQRCPRREPGRVGH